MEKKRSQLNIRTDIETEMFLDKLVEKLGKTKTELIKLMVIDFSLGYLTEKERELIYKKVFEEKRRI